MDRLSAVGYLDEDRCFPALVEFTGDLAVPGFAALDEDYIDYHVVVDPRPDGRVIGFFAGAPIAARVVDLFGRGFVYDGVAPRRGDGRYDPAGLRPGEWIVEPGLVYHIDGAQQESDRADPCRDAG